MQRTFTMTWPADANYYRLYDRMLLLTGAVPTDGILPDRVANLQIQNDPQNATDIFITDFNSANSEGRQVIPGAYFEVTSDRNSICLKDYYIKGNALKISATFEAR